MVSQAFVGSAQWIKGRAGCNPLELGSFGTYLKAVVGRIGFVVAYQILVINTHHITTAMATSTSMANTSPFNPSVITTPSVITNTAILEEVEEDIDY